MSSNVLVCPKCRKLNNVQQSEFANSPQCSGCEQPLLRGVAIEADATLFNRFITHSTIPVVVKFWGPWSGKSQEMVDVVASLAQTFKQDVVFLKMNSEQEQVLANNYKLIDIPTFIMFKSGAEYRRIQGMISERDLHGWLERYLRIKRKKIVQYRSSV